MEEKNIIDVRFRNVNRGQEKLQCHRGEGTLFAERSQGERKGAGERAACRIQARCHSVGLPWVVLRENAPHPGAHLEEGILPL